MTSYLVVAGLCAVLLPVAWRRSGSMTRYVVGAGAPLVLVLLGLFSVLCAVLARADGSLAREVFTGALVGSGFTQLMLVRRTAAGDAARRPERPRA